MKTRPSKNGEVLVILRVTVNKQRVTGYVNLKVSPENWNPTAEKSFGRIPKDEELNLRIDAIRVKIMKIYREMELDGIEITAQKVVDRYLGRDVKPKVMLLDIFGEHNERYRKLAENAIFPATLERCIVTFNHTANFIKSAYHVDDVPV